MKSSNGKIIKSVGGIYTVETADGIIKCKPRGILRHMNISPAAGDNVEIDFIDNEPVIASVGERKNYIVRPPLANLDVAVMVVSSVDPKPNTYIIDKLIAIFECKNIETVLVFTKQDLDKCADIVEIYISAGFKTFTVDNINGESDFNAVSAYLQGKTIALIGNSGVGKSSLLNRLFPGVNAITGITSKKLGRGKHTTRQVELFRLNDNTYIADTPGFSTVDSDRYIDIESEEVQLGFREFKPFLEHCQFADCAHNKETNCAIKQAVADKKISYSRYDNYIRMYSEAKNKKQY